MIGRIVEIAEDQRHLSLDRGFLVVSERETEIGRVPLDDIAAVIGNAHGLTYSNNILVALAERNAPFVLCAANHNPVAMLWPVEGNYLQAGRMDAQIDAAKPLQKRLWADIVKSKLGQQAAVLRAVGAPDIPLTALIRQVRSGDPENNEAQGAKRYWNLLFGDTFRRDRSAEGLNALLNYGYMILRSAAARAVLAAGLHPTLGIHHSNMQNSMRLVDDLMEPFRPLVDYNVHALQQAEKLEVDRFTKRHMAQLMYQDLQTEVGATPVMQCIQRLATSLAQIYMGEKEQLDLPPLPRPLDLVALSKLPE